MRENKTRKQVMGVPSIYLITGIAAAGKSTVGELLAERFSRSVHLRGDVFRKMVVRGREDMNQYNSHNARQQMGLRYDIGALSAQHYHRAGFDVAYQDVMLGSLLPEVVARIVARPLYVIVLCPDPKIVTLREADRMKTGYAAGYTPEAMHHLMMKETPRIGLWLDTSELNPSETVDLIIRRTSRGEGSIP